ncbi:MAG: polysaccharide biosynthesis tyrosine autokinase [Burkholderiaceae bacterium]
MKHSPVPRDAILVHYGHPAAPMPAQTASAPPAGRAASESEFAPLLRMLWAQRRWLITAAVLAGLITAAYVWQLPAKYRSTATILVESGRSQVLSIEELRSNGESREHFQAQAEILQSRELAQKAVRALRLTETADFDPTRGGGPIAWLRALLPGGDDAPDEARIEAEATEMLMKAVKIEATRLSGTIRLTIETTSPELSASIANQMARLYIDDDREMRSALSRQVSGQLVERAEELRTKLASSETELQKYRETVGIVNLGTTQQSMLAQQLNSITERLITARVRRIELEGAWRKLRAPGGQGADIGQIQRDPAYSAAKAKVDDIDLRLTQASQKYGSEYAQVKELRAQRDQARAALDALRTSLANSIISDYESARISEKELLKLLDKAKAGALDVNRSEPQLLVLEREVESNRQLYEMFVKRAKETALAAELLPAVARVIDEAVPATKPSGPPRTPLVLLAAVAAATLTALMLLARAIIDRRLRDPDQAEQSLGQTVLATLPTIPRATSSSAARTYLNTPRSQYAEAIRTARIAVMLRSLENPCRMVMVTSTLQGEGKTTFACNLALAYARSRRTLLIDANLRKPRVAECLGMPVDSPGISNLISGKEPSRACMHALPETRLIVLPAGTFNVNPQELFLSPRFSRMLDSLASLFEVVIIDTPAVEPASDSVLLASMISSSVVVAERSRAGQERVRRSIALLSDAGSKVLGVVMNRVGREERVKPPMRGDPEADTGYESLHGAHQPEPFVASLPDRSHETA